MIRHYETHFVAEIHSQFFCKSGLLFCQLKPSPCMHQPETDRIDGYAHLLFFRQNFRFFLVNTVDRIGYEHDEIGLEILIF